MALKMAAQKQSLKELLVPTEDVMLTELSGGDITPPHSDVGSLSPKSEVSTPSSPEDHQYSMVIIYFRFKKKIKLNFTTLLILQMKEEDEVINVGGMADHTRLTLCMFMLAVLSFNPFGIVLDRFSNAETAYTSAREGRTILNFDGMYFL